MDARAGQDILERLQVCRLVTAEQIEKIRAEFEPDAGTDAVISLLQQRQLVTEWQLDEIGKEKPLLYLDNDRYLLQELIGKGGMGNVYRARHLRMNRDVAIKIISPKHVQDQSVIDRFRREVEVSSKLQHEHIVQAFDVGTEGGLSYLVLEFVSGSDLGAIVNRDGPLEPAEAAAVCMQAASGLAYAHTHNVVHRDIKPQNILLSTTGIAKILDMGLARLLSSADEDDISALTQEGTVMGTVDFMAPEQALDAHTADSRSDIYSLGATFYFLLTGRKPFPGGTAMDKLMRLANQNPSPVGQQRPDCPREVADIVEQMMAKRPNDRFQTTEEIVRQLQPYAAQKISGRPVVTVAVQTAANTRREGGLEHTIANTPVFQPESSMALRTVRRRKQKSHLGWFVGGSGLFVFVLLCVTIWNFNQPEFESPDNSPVSPPLATPTSAEQPPADYRIHFNGHFGCVNAAAWSPNGQYLATCGGDGEVRIWNADASQTLSVYRGHRANVRHAEFSVNSGRVISTDCAGEVHVWETLSGKQIARIERPGEAFGAVYMGDGASFSPDGKEIAYFDRPNIVRYSLKDKRTIWDVPCPLDRNNRKFIRYSPDGKYLAAGSAHSHLSQPLVWELLKGDLVHQHQATGDLSFLGFSRDSLLVVVQGNVLQIARPANGDIVKEWPLEGSFYRENSNLCKGGNICGIARIVGPRKTGVTIALNLENGETVTLPKEALIAPVGSRYVTRLPSPNSANLRINRLDGFVVNRAFGHTALPEPNAIRLLAGRYLKTGWGWFDLVAATIVREFPDNSVVLPDGRIRALIEDRILEWPSVAAVGDKFRIVCTLEECEDYLPSIRWTDNGQQLWSLGPQRQGTRFVRFWNPEKGTVNRTLDLTDLNKDLRYCVAHVSSTGETVLVKANSECGVWEIEKGLSPRKFKWNHHLLIAASSDVKWIVNHEADQRSDDANHLDLIDSISGENNARIETGLGPSYVYDIVARFSPSDNYLLTSRQVWDIRPAIPKRLWNCPEWSSAVGRTPGSQVYTNCAWFPDEEHVLLRMKAQYQVWNWKQNKKLLTLFMLPNDNWVAVNNSNGYWSGTPLAHVHLRCRFEAKEGEFEWITPREYEKRTGFKRDEARVGLRLLKKGQSGSPNP